MNGIIYEWYDSSYHFSVFVETIIKFLKSKFSWKSCRKNVQEQPNYKCHKFFFLISEILNIFYHFCRVYAVLEIDGIIEKEQNINYFLTFNSFIILIIYRIMRTNCKQQKEYKIEHRILTINCRIFEISFAL